MLKNLLSWIDILITHAMNSSIDSARDLLSFVRLNRLVHLHTISKK